MHCATTTMIQITPETVATTLFPIITVPGMVPTIERTPNTIVATNVMKKHPNRIVESVRVAS